MDFELREEWMKLEKDLYKYSVDEIIDKKKELKEKYKGNTHCPRCARQLLLITDFVQCSNCLFKYHRACSKENKCIFCSGSHCY